MSDLSNISVEIAVTGTWRESVIAADTEEAEEVVERRVLERLGVDEGQWGDMGITVVGSREVDE